MSRQFGALVGLCGDKAIGGRIMVMTGGGPGIMEAVNRGACDVGAPSIGLNIDLPHEQYPNPYVTPDLCFSFRYFAMRKLHFLLRARALVAFPGGYGTIDEVFEVLTLSQTRKLASNPVILLYGSSYWKEIVNFDALVKYQVVAPEDLQLFQFADDPVTAFELLKTGLLEYAAQSDTPETPAIAKSTNPQKPAGI